MAMILALLPAAETGLLDKGTIICDGKTGVSGAGINPGRDNSYSLRYDNANTYREGKHQHLVEVENILTQFSANKNESNKILFVPQIVPMTRGILMTVYADINNKIDTAMVNGVYRDYYKDSPFVIISDTSPNTQEVRGTNRCVIKAQIDKRTGKLLIISALDNLMKGQSGNAVQNANIRLGFDQTEGLNLNPFYP